MAGLWERVRGDADDRINIHLIEAALGGYHINAHIDGTKGFTRVQVKDTINNELIANGAAVLTAAEETDLNAIADEIDAQANDTARLHYLVGAKAVFIAAELEEITEAKWRADLGI